jgi:hypothetical protein
VAERTVFCDACDELIDGDDYDNRHTGHESDCPLEQFGSCQCDINWHSHCCAECNADEGSHE